MPKGNLVEANTVCIPFQELLAIISFPKKHVSPISHPSDPWERTVHSTLLAPTASLPLSTMTSFLHLQPRPLLFPGGHTYHPSLYYALLSYEIVPSTSITAAPGIVTWETHQGIIIRLILFKKDFIYLFLKRGEGKEKERERSINVWLPLTHPMLGTWFTTQACALTGNQPATLWFTGWHSIHWAAPARALFFLIKRTF